jgi:general secretion pathway protein G
MKSAFTMIELVFVIVILGILAAVAIPKMWVTRDDAIIVKLKTQVSTIQAAISSKYTKLILEGNNSCPNLENDPNDDKLFEGILNNPIYKNSSSLKWDGNGTDYNATYNSSVVKFKYDNNPDNGCKFYCDSASGEFSCDLFR